MRIGNRKSQCLISRDGFWKAVGGEGERGGEGGKKGGGDGRGKILLENENQKKISLIIL